MLVDFAEQITPVDRNFCSVDIARLIGQQKANELTYLAGRLNEWTDAAVHGGREVGLFRFLVKITGGRYVALPGPK